MVALRDPDALKVAFRDLLDAGKASLPAWDAGKESLTDFESLCRGPAGAGGQWTSCP